MSDATNNGPVGQVAAHVSGDEDGPICGWSFNVGDGRIIYAGEISNSSFADLSDEQQEAFGGKPFGWFLMCFWHDRHEVWAKAGDEDQAKRLVTLIGSMLYAGALWREEKTQRHGSTLESILESTRPVDQAVASPAALAGSLPELSPVELRVALALFAREATPLYRMHFRVELDQLHEKGYLVAAEGGWPPTQYPQRVRLTAAGVARLASQKT